MECCRFHSHSQSCLFWAHPQAVCKPHKALAWSWSPLQRTVCPYSRYQDWKNHFQHWDLHRATVYFPVGDMCCIGNMQYLPEVPLLEGIDRHLQVLGRHPDLCFIEEERQMNEYRQTVYICLTQTCVHCLYFRSTDISPI